MTFKAIAMASDHRGYWLKKDIMAHLKSIGFYITDYGAEDDCVTVDYPDYAKKVAEHVLTHDKTFGILTSYAGIGMAIAANRFKGIRAVFCDRLELPKLAREQIDANIICFGSAFISLEYAIRCSEIFAETFLSDERYMKRINKIDEA